MTKLSLLYRKIIELELQNPSPSGVCQELRTTLHFPKAILLFIFITLDFGDCIVLMELRAPTQRRSLALTHSCAQALAGDFSHLPWRLKKKKKKKEGYRKIFIP